MHSVLVLFVAVVASVTFVVAENRIKRLVLQSETGFEEEIVKLRAEVNGLTATVTNLNSEITFLKSNLQNVNKTGHGSTYVRWGSNICSGNGTRLVYKGYMAGSHYSQTGNGPNHLCLPDDPTWAKYDDGNQASWRSYIYGTEFDENGDVIFGKHVKDEDIPCTVCQVPGVSLMMPARADCYPGWQLEYTGYLMSGYHGYQPTDYVCVDGDPDFITGGAADVNGHLLYLVEGVCGVLECPPYHNYRELACSVCSM